MLKVYILFHLIQFSALTLYILSIVEVYDIVIELRGTDHDVEDYLEIDAILQVFVFFTAIFPLCAWRYKSFLLTILRVRILYQLAAAALAYWGVEILFNDDVDWGEPRN